MLIYGIGYCQTVDLVTAETVAKNYFKHSFENGIRTKSNFVHIETENLQIKNSQVKKATVYHLP